MPVKKYSTLIESEFGKRLDYLRIRRGFNTIKDFGKEFNNGKIHKDFSAYIKGKNTQFRTMIRFAMTLKFSIAILLDFDKTMPLDSLPENLTIDELMKLELETFSKNIKRLREEKFSTQLNFETIIGISRENITNYELGKIRPNIVNIGRFANGFKEKPATLFIKKDAL